MVRKKGVCTVGLVRRRTLLARLIEEIANTRDGASAPMILCALERSSIEVVCLTRNSCSDGLILLQQHKNTISDKNIW